MPIILSIIVPAFNEAGIIENSVSQICKVAEAIGHTYEVIVVDDGSSDDTWDLVRQLSLKQPSIKGIRFSRNFGKEQAVFAGIDRAEGAAVVILDADLQHPPEIIAKMFNIWCNGEADVIQAVKSHRGSESYLYKICSRMFYRTMKSLSGLELKNASDFVLLDQKVVRALRSLPEQTPFLRGLVAWVGFRQVSIEFAVAPRSGGNTKWKRGALIKYALSNFLTFSSLPLQIVSFLALIFFIFALVLGSYSIYKYIDHNAVEGFTTVIIILLLMGSGIMTGLGIIGEYISKIHDEAKQRPRYLTMDEIGGL